MRDALQKLLILASLWIGCVSLLPRVVSAAPLEGVVGTWTGEIDGGRIRADIARRGGRLVGEIHVERGCVTLRMVARGNVRRGVVTLTARRLGVAQVRCGQAPEGGEHPLLQLSAPMPVNPLGDEWTLATPAVMGRTTPRGRFVQTSAFWMPGRSTIRMMRISDTPATTPDVPELEPAVAERICPL